MAGVLEEMQRGQAITLDQKFRSDGQSVAPGRDCVGW
jgi:hypothetical protein